MNRPVADVFEFAILLSHIAQGQEPSEVCATLGLSFPSVQAYAQEHNLAQELAQAIDFGVAVNDSDDEECVITDRGECTTCAE